MMRRFEPQRGYTLIELLGSLFVAMVGMAAASSYMGRVPGLDYAASEVAASLRLARSRAILNGTTTGVQFRPSANLYMIFDDTGLDGLGPSDGAYEGPDADGTEGNHRYDAEDGRRERASDFKNTLAKGIIFGILADPDTPAPDGSGAIGEDAIPSSTRALVFNARGRLANHDPGKSFVYLTDGRQIDMRAIWVDPVTGGVTIYRWNVFDETWTY
jgi:hypothetical protein